MRAILFAIAAMFSIGAADFWGALGSREGRPTAVAAWSQGLGIIGVLAALPLVGGAPSSADLAYGAAAGVAVGLGLMSLYLGFARAPIGVIAPVASIVTVSIPVLLGIFQGERPSQLAILGIGFGVAGVGLVGAGRIASVDGRAAGLLFGFAAGVGFGLGLALLGKTAEASGLWPLAASRIMATASIVTFTVLVSRSLHPVRASYRYILLAAVFGSFGLGLFTIAIQTGPLTAVGVITAMFPAVTVALAAIVAHERLLPRQLAGVVLTIVAVVMITAA